MEAPQPPSHAGLSVGPAWDDRAGDVSPSELDLALADRGKIGAAAVELFTELNVFSGAAFMRHNLRLFRIARLLLARARIEFDPQVAFAIAVVHDLGLIVPHRAGRQGAEKPQGLAPDLCAAMAETRCYTERSWLLYEHALSRHTTEDLEVTRDCLTLNHRIAPLRGTSPIAECFRQAVWAEHSLGRLRFGLGHEELAQIFREHPRRGLNGVLFNFWSTTLRREPASVVRGILFEGPARLPGSVPRSVPERTAGA